MRAGLFRLILGGAMDAFVDGAFYSRRGAAPHCYYYSSCSRPLWSMGVVWYRCATAAAAALLLRFAMFAYE